MGTLSNPRRNLTENQKIKILENIEAQIKSHSSIVGHNRLFGIARIIARTDNVKWVYRKPTRGSRIYPELLIPGASFDAVIDMLRNHGYVIEITTDTSMGRFVNISKPQ